MALVAGVIASILATLYYVKLKENLQNDLNKIVKEQYMQAGYERKTASLDKLQIKVNK